MRDARDVALESFAHDEQLLTDQYVAALAEAVTYREMLLEALNLLYLETKRRERAEARLAARDSSA